MEINALPKYDMSDNPQTVVPGLIQLDGMSKSLILKISCLLK